MYNVIRNLFALIGAAVVSLLLAVGALHLLLNVLRYGSTLAVFSVLFFFTGLFAVGGLIVLNEIVKRLKSPANPSKTKREVGSMGTDADARLALLLNLMTPDERDELKTRLVDELAADGEALPLADLIAQQNGASDRH